MYERVTPIKRKQGGSREGPPVVAGTEEGLLAAGRRKVLGDVGLLHCVGHRRRHVGVGRSRPCSACNLISRIPSNKQGLQQVNTDDMVRVSRQAAHDIAVRA